MKTIRIACCNVIAAALMVTGGTASANSDADANARLAFSDKLSMYSMRIAGSACVLTSGNAPYESNGFLSVARLEVNRILEALEDGDPALGIATQEENEDILAQLLTIKGQWAPIDRLALDVRNGNSTSAKVADLDEQIDAFTKTSLRLVTTVSNKYTNADQLSLTSAIRIQVAGRQRMLAQKLSYVACNMMRAPNEETAAELTETLKVFELSIDALRDGMPEVGLVSTSEPELLEALEQISLAWSEVKWPLIALQNGAAWGPVTQKRMFVQINELTHVLDKSVVQFTKAARAAGA